MFARPYIFADRRDAGRQLAGALRRFRDADPIIMALPRGGVPVAVEVAKALEAPLDLLIVRKIGAPGHSELGIGAVVDGSDPQIVLNEEAMRFVAPPAGYVEAEMQRQLREIEARRQKYLAGRRALPIAGRTVIVVDDGIATGGTVRVALRAMSRAGAARVILAVPVAPPDTLDALQADAGEIICLSTPDPFFSVGEHYASFEQTSDEEVIRLMDEVRPLVA